MANLKQRLHRKNASGSYDVIYLETNATIVKRADGVTSVEDSLSAIEAWDPLRYEVKEDGSIASPFVPQLDAKTLEGHPASYFAVANDYVRYIKGSPIKLDSLGLGQSFTIKENGNDATFVVVDKDYLGTGSILVCRNLPYDGYNETITASAADYAGSSLDTYMNDTYFNILSCKDSIISANYYGQYYSNSWIAQTLNRKVVTVGVAELGLTVGIDLTQYTNQYIKNIADASTYSIRLRTPYSNTQYWYVYVSTNVTSSDTGLKAQQKTITDPNRSQHGKYLPLPMFCLPKSFIIPGGDMYSYILQDNEGNEILRV
jgi:hypothetical protein